MAENFDVDLMELAVSAFLGAFAPEHGTDSVELGDRIGGVEMMLKIGPDDRGCGFRPERQAFIAPIPEGVHLLFHDIRSFPYPPGEEIGLFQNGYADLPATEGGEDFPCLVFHILPSPCFLGKDVLKTFDSGNEFHNLSIRALNFLNQGSLSHNQRNGNGNDDGRGRPGKKEETFATGTPTVSTGSGGG